jgi:hypothetical protein
MTTVASPELEVRFSLLDAITNDVNQHKHRRTSRLLSADAHTQNFTATTHHPPHMQLAQPSSISHLPFPFSLFPVSLFRLTGLLESSPSAPSQLQRFLTRFHTANSPSSDTAAESGDGEASSPSITAESITGVCFILNSQAFEAMLEAPSPLLLSLMCSLRRSGGSADTRTDASSGVASVKVLSFVEETPRAFPLFATRALRLQPADDWPNPAPGTAVTGGSGTEAGAGLASTLSAPPHTPSPLLPFTFSTLHSMLLLASHVATLPSLPAQREFLLSAAPSRQLLERIVSVERCVGYSQCAELMSAEDFCSLNQHSLHISLMSGSSELSAASKCSILLTPAAGLLRHA